MSIHPVKIGSVTVPHGLFLAPMAGMTDSAFRIIARKAGAEYCISEMISALAMCYGDRKTATLARIPSCDSPIALQIFGHEPEAMAKAAVMLATGDFPGCDYATRPAAIDINMGCPVKKIVSSGDGSALMKNPDLASEIVLAVKRATDKIGIPVTVKIRAGWDKNNVNAPDFARRLASSGADAIYVHARTREQMYAPPIDATVIARVRNAVPFSIPVIGNGDIQSADDAEAMLAETGCDGMMIGRSALGNPWLFSEIAARADGRDFVMPDVSERIETAKLMIRMMTEEKGEAVAIREARARAAYFIRDIRGAAQIRYDLNHAETYDEFARVLDGVRERESFLRSE